MADFVRVIGGLDRAATTWVAAQFAAPSVQWLLLPFTAIGYGGFVWLALAAIGSIATPYLVGASAVASMRAALWRAVLAVLLSLLLVENVCKPLVGRERPFVHGPKAVAIVWVPTTTSFPSGHAASAAAGALAFSRVWPAATLPLWVLAALISLSRVALGVHFVGDVAAGSAFGLLAASLGSVRAEPPPGDGKQLSL